MKKIYLLIASIILTTSVFAQAPELMSYQAIIRDASDALIQNGNIGIQISILQGSETGTAVYTEAHTTITNDNGLATLNIGAGTSTDNFSTIDWSTGSYYIKSETDPAGGTNYTISGTSQLLSVPYALYAKSSEQSNNSQGASGSSIISSNDVDGEGEISVVYTNTEAKAFFRNGTGNGSWSSTSLNSAPLGAVATNDIVVVYTNTEVKAFFRNGTGNGSWSSTSLNSAPLGAIATNDIVVVYTNTEAKAFFRNGTGNGSWSSTSLNGTSSGVVKANDIVSVYTATEAKAFYRNGSGNGSWSSTSLSGSPIGSIGSAEIITIFTATEAKAFYRNGSGNGSWSSTSLNGTPQGIISSN